MTWQAAVPWLLFPCVQPAGWDTHLLIAPVQAFPQPALGFIAGRAVPPEPELAPALPLAVPELPLVVPVPAPLAVVPLVAPVAAPLPPVTTPLALRLPHRCRWWCQRRW